jgi:hypothetical protein
MRTLFNRIKGISPVLYYFSFGFLLLFFLLALLTQIDHRQISGVNLWLKPSKFALSIAIYCLTWPLYLQYLPDEKLKRRFANFTAFAMSFEVIAIVSQAARGQMSHYNISSTYNALVFSSMGIVIVSQTLFALFIGVVFFRIKAIKLSPALLWAIRLGIIMSCIFALEGGIMASRLAHSVGASDAGPGLPILNWSRVAGDLRLAHFVGMHALQVLPLFVLIGRVKRSYPLQIFGILYFLLVSILFYNAMLGRPLF